MSSGTPDSGDAPASSNPFAALRALRDRLPEGPPPDAAPLRAEPDSGPARLVVRRERKGHGGKTATRVQGFALDESERSALVKEAKRALGCGARWESDELLFQGDLLERVAKWFEARGHRVVRGN
ncbi:MAG: translation initiation factor [Planctomycetes bacterium]|nr:translation initiation factor [Planctomycetota bacterium]MCB9904054.1 translation initiation factor [Planctomycetota bacterium]